MEEQLTAHTPSEALRMGLCPMCLGHGELHKFVPTEHVGVCSGCDGGKTLDAFWLHQDREAGVPALVVTCRNCLQSWIDDDEPLCVCVARGDRPRWTTEMVENVTHVPPTECPHGIALTRPCADCAQADRPRDRIVTSGRPMGEEVAPSSPFKHDAVFARFPSGTDPLAAIKESMSVFMEREDGTNAMGWWSTKRWWHGGPAGFKRGDILLPPSVTGVVPGMPGTDPESVYITTSRDDALMFAARHNQPMLYEVAKLREPVHDELLPADDETSWKVPAAEVYRIEQPSALELRRVLYELNRPTE